MSIQEKCKDFDFQNNPYEEEARKRWGDQIVEDSNRKVQKMSTLEQKAFAEKNQAVFQMLASLRHLNPASDEAQSGIEMWYDLVNQMGSYSPEAFKKLGQMYIEDERFLKNIDQYGEGLARFMCDAMALFSEKNQQ